VKRGEIASLTGLRGLAALLVVINHFALWTRIVDQPQELLQRLTSTDAVAMAIFFTLSGYVIALSYGDWDWQGQPGFNLVRLLLYRVARLYPAFLVFAWLIVLRSPTLRDLSDPDVDGYLLSRVLLVYTWLPHKYEGMLPYEDHFHVAWSLSVEAGLYLGFGLAAIVIAMLPKGRFRTVSLAVVFFVVTWVLLGEVWSARATLAPDWEEWTWGYWLYLHSPWGVSLQFVTGVLAYKAGRRLPVSLAAWFANAGGLGLLAIYGLIATRVVKYPTDQALLASAATAFVMIGCHARSATTALLSARALVYLGTISYSLYLFHFLAPHLGFAGTSARFEGNVAVYQSMNFAFAIFVAIIIASGMYRLVELPGRRVLRAFADRLLGLRRPALTAGQPAE
jgi:peptidoglycan/LPS O-acetylase OafA/YrhL